MSERLLTINELAELLQVTRQTVNQLRASGDGPPELKLSDRVIRFRESAVQEWLDEHEEERKTA